MTLVLDNMALSRLAADASIRDAFPILVRLIAPPKAGGCNCADKRGPDFNEVRAAIAGMPATDQARFKVLAGADTVVVNHRAGSRIVTTTF